MAVVSLLANSVNLPSGELQRDRLQRQIGRVLRLVFRRPLGTFAAADRPDLADGREVFLKSRNGPKRIRLSGALSRSLAGDDS